MKYTNTSLIDAIKKGKPYLQIKGNQSDGILSASIFGTAIENSI
jgi:hypothetical protein